MGFACVLATAIGVHNQARWRSHTILEPGLFADVAFLTTLPYAAHLGAYPWPYGKGHSAPPSVEDIAAVAASVLSDPARHAGRRYCPTGPQLLDGPAMASIIGKVLNRRVRLAPMPLGLFMRAARLDGLPISLLASLRYYIEDYAQGAFALGAPNDDTMEVTGRAPETFESVARRHAVSIRRGFGPSLKQFLRFMMVPMVPPPAVGRYIRGLHMPEPINPVSAAQSSTWRQEHRVDETYPRRTPHAQMALRITAQV